MLYAYLGTDARYYQDYIDAATGRMLEAVPGEGPYDVRVAPGRVPGLPLPPGDGRWGPAPARAPRPPRTAKTATPPAGGPSAFPDPPPATAAAEAAPSTTEEQR